MLKFYKMSTLLISFKNVWVLWYDYNLLVLVLFQYYQNFSCILNYACGLHVYIRYFSPIIPGSEVSIRRTQILIEIVKDPTHLNPFNELKKPGVKGVGILPLLWWIVP